VRLPRPDSPLLIADGSGGQRPADALTTAATLSRPAVRSEHIALGVLEGVGVDEDGQLFAPVADAVFAALAEDAAEEE
jgi:hypothetical protein